MSIADEIRAKLAAMTDAEKERAFERLMAAIAQTDDEIAAEVEAMTDDEIAAELRAGGVDPESWAAQVLAEIERLKP